MVVKPTHGKDIGRYICPTIATCSFYHQHISSCKCSS